MYKKQHDNTIYKMSLSTVKSMHLNSMVRCVGNFCRQSCNGMSALFVIDVWSKGMYQFVSDGHVHNVCWSQLELKRIHVDVTQHEPHKAVLGIVTILNSCRQHVDTWTAGTSTLITAKPDKTARRM